MSTRKPDRWERALGRHHGDEDDWRAKCIPAQRVLDLLRKEHRAVMRIVNREKVSGINDSDREESYNQACDDLLAKLKARAQ